MNRLPKEKQLRVINALVEGCSIRSTERMFDVHRDTIMRLLVATGEKCREVLATNLKDVRTTTLEVDELWSFVGKKERRLTPEDRLSRPDLGDNYIFVAMDRQTKLVNCHRIGKRTPDTANTFIKDLRGRIQGEPSIVTDGFAPYVGAIWGAFEHRCRYGQLVKTIRESRFPVREGYGPGRVVKCEPSPIIGFLPSQEISTSIVERQNLSARTHCKRLARLSICFSRKLPNLVAALDLHYAFYNLCRVHKTLRVTPAMAAGITSEIWSLESLLPN